MPGALVKNASGAIILGGSPMHVSRHLAKSVGCIPPIPLSIATLFASGILLAWLVIPTVAPTQSVILVGTISDVDTDSTIERAEFSNQPSSVITATAPDGTHQLNSDQLPSESVSIFVVKPIYIPVQIAADKEITNKKISKKSTSKTK